MLAVVTYLWGAFYRPAHVQQLARSVARHLPAPHRFVCITDQAIAGVETMRNPVRRFDARCYRRLWLFSEEATVLGARILHLDLDLVICGDLEPFAGAGVAFRIYRAPSIARLPGGVVNRGYSLNPSVCALEAGTQADIWRRFTADPARVSRAAAAAGFWGSDQAVIGYLRQAPDVPTFGEPDGLVSFRRIRNEQLTAPPAGTRIVSFHGRRSPFDRAVQAAHPWIRDAWAEAA